jgi:hypothetical protein
MKAPLHDPDQATRLSSHPTTFRSASENGPSDNTERLKRALRAVFDDPSIAEITAEDRLGEWQRQHTRAEPRNHLATPATSATYPSY